MNVLLCSDANDAAPYQGGMPFGDGVILVTWTSFGVYSGRLTVECSLTDPRRIGRFPLSSPDSAHPRYADLCERTPPKPTEFTVSAGRANAVIVVQLTTDNYQSGIGYTSAFACVDGFRNTSSLNNTNAAISSNLVVVATDAAGKFCVKSQQPTDLVVDVMGTLTGASISSPIRVLDTRTAGGRGTDFRVHIGPASATVVLQVTTDNYTGGTGFTSAYDCTTGLQGTSSLNNKASPIASNTVIAHTDSKGDVCVKSQAVTDLIVDLVGTLANTSTIAAPQRVLDTRIVGSRAKQFNVHVGHPNSVVVVQVTTDNYDTGTGYTSVYACATGFQNTSTLNNTGNPVASNLAMVPTDANGDICIDAQHATDLIVDLLGTISDANIHSPVRVLDTRSN